MAQNSDVPFSAREIAPSTVKSATEKAVMERNCLTEMNSASKTQHGVKLKTVHMDGSPVAKCMGTYHTPVRSSYKKRMSHVIEYGFASLPVYSNSPSQHSTLEVSNPFDDALTQRLHLPFFSPSVFSRVVSPSQAEHQFCWTIDDVANLQPAPIEEVPDEQDQTDPEVELRAQEAISRYFRSHQIVPSPWSGGDHAKGTNVVNAFESPKSVVKAKESVTEKYQVELGSAVEKVSVPTQTALSFPPELPLALEEALKPYFLIPKVTEQKSVDDELSTSSVRRKRLFTEGMCVSPTTSPLRGGLVNPTFKEHLYPSTPITNVRTFEVNNEISPPQFSPISKETELPRSSKSMTRLDFTANMSVDDIDHGTKFGQDGIEGVCCNSNKENVKPVVSRSDRLGDTGYNTASICANDITMSNVTGQARLL